MLVIWLCLSCLGHRISEYKYINVGPGSSVVLREYKVWVDKGFGNADRLAIDDAIRQWNYTMNGYVKMTVISYDFDMEIEELRQIMNSGGWIIMKIDSSNPMVDDGPTVNGKPTSYTLAWVNGLHGTKMWIIRDRIVDSRWMTGIVLHEMGHMLGADHDEAYLMGKNFDWEKFRCVDYQTAIAAAKAQRIPLGVVNYCIYL